MTISIFASVQKNELPQEHTDIYLADTIGDLGTLYNLSPVSFIGGSFVPHGGQNPIEAIRLGSCVLTGKHTQNFQDGISRIISQRWCTSNSFC